jgi:hypothetical protein
MPENLDLQGKLDDLAIKIVDDALKTESSKERLEAFKLLTNYRIGMKKIEDAPPPDDDENLEDFNFDASRKSVEASGRGPDDIC